MGESEILAAMLCDPGCIGRVVALIEPRDFAEPEDRKLYQAILAVSKDGLRPDTSLLVKKGIPLSRIMELEGEFASSSNIEHYCQMLKKERIMRQLGLAMEKEKDPLEVFDFLQTEMRNLKPPKEDTFKDLLGQALEQMKTGGTRGIGTGIPLLNRCTNGLQQGHFIVLGARPAVGKTALAVNLASHIRKEHKVSFFSLEMPALSIAQRILCLESNIPFSRLIRGKVDADEKRRLQDAFKILSNSGVFIHAGDSRMATIKEQIRRDVEEGAKLVIIDYLNLISGVSGRQRWEMVGEITREIKLTAMERKIPIIGLAQLGRVAEKEKPTLADLRESGSIEQDADLVGLLIRERDSEEAILDVAKNRHGAPRKINLTFNAELMVFSQEGI